MTSNQGGRSPAVSVIIPTYNHAVFLKQALESVIAQSFQDWEAIVINNFSEDDTIDVVQAFDDPRIRLENFRNGGVIAASRNRGIELSLGRYIAFLDSDDTWFPEKLAQSIARLAEGFDVVCHGVRWIGERRPRDLMCGPESRATFESLLLNGTCLIISATVIESSWLKTVDRFSEDPAFITAEDLDLWLKLARAGARIGFIMEILGEYRFHSGNQSGAAVYHMQATVNVTKRYIGTKESANCLYRWRIKRRLAMIYYGAARSLQDNGQFSMAWPLLAKAIKESPIYLKTYVAVGMNLIHFSPNRARVNPRKEPLKARR